MADLPLSASRQNPGRSVQGTINQGHIVCKIKNHSIKAVESPEIKFLASINRLLCHKIVFRKIMLLPLFIFATLIIEKKKITYSVGWQPQ